MVVKQGAGHGHTDGMRHHVNAPHSRWGFGQQIVDHPLAYTFHPVGDGRRVFAGGNLHDHGVFTAEFLGILEASGVKSVKLPQRAPNLNAHAERFVRTIKETCLERLILFGEGSLRRAIHDFVLNYHHERNHQGLDNELIMKEESYASRTGAVQRRQRLGGMLNYYYRPAA